MYLPLEKLLKLNEALNNVIEQYGEVKKGNLVKVALPSEEADESHNSHNRRQGGNGDSASTPKQKSKETSLIDLIEEESDGSNSSASTPKTTGRLHNISKSHVSSVLLSEWKF